MPADHVSPPAPSSQGRVVLSRRKKLIFSLVTMILFFLLLECGLWLAGVQTIATSADPYVGFAGNLPLFVAETDADGSEWMTTAPNKLAWFNPERFPREKAPGVKRVFCLGGSTTYGRPYDKTTAFSAWLGELLPSASTEPEWEVINAGGISYASYRVTALMEELAQYQPDLFVVYTGHNEFLEERTYGELRDKPQGLLQTAALLGKTRTFGLLRNVLTGTPKPPEERAILPSEVDAVLDHSVGPSSYHRDDPLRQKILAHLELNLERMADIAQRCGAELVLVVPAVNLKDCSPFKSEHAEGLSESQIKRWNQKYEEAARLENAGQFKEALAAYQEAAKIDPRYAEVHFRIGRLLLQSGRASEASSAFQKALDEDICPLRAPSEFQQAVRSFARSRGIPLVDFDAIIKNDCLVLHGHNAPGSEYFLDHVHPTIDGHQMAAVAIIEQLANEKLFELNPISETDIAQATSNIHRRIDPEKHAIAERNLAKVLNWAGKHEEAGRLALKSLKTLPDDPESLVIGAAYLRSQGQIEQAIEYLFRAVGKMPEYADAHRLLGAMLVDARRFDEAREQFLMLTRLEPKNAAAWQMVGAILAEQKQYEEALEYYRKALSLDAEDANLHYNLGYALARLKRSDEAKNHLRRAVDLNPKDQAARGLLAELESAKR